MGTITSGTGLISGINTTDVINQLLAIDGQQNKIVQSHIDDATSQRTAFTDLQTRLTGIQITSQQIAKPSFFANATATSSDPTVATATAGPGTPVGSYQFQVARLVQAEQLVSGGFSNFDQTPVGAGTLTLERGGGSLEATNNLNDLRGGQGVSRGQIRVTDRTGKSAVIDLGDAVTLDDVVKKFNTSVDINVRASVADNKLTLTDASGGTTGNLTVQDVGNTTAAADLGLTATAATTSTAGAVTGSNLQFVGRDSTLASLNDGTGVSDITGEDFQINLKNGSAVKVDLNGAATVGQAIDAINTVANGKATASLNADGTGITLTDTSGGGGALTVTSIGNSTAAADLGLTTAAAGNTITGAPIQAQLGTVLLKTLNGGAGLTLGTLHIADRSGTAKDIDLSGAKTLKDVFDAINTSGAAVTAGLNNSGNGISITDTSGSAGNLVISDASGTGATQLGINGTFDVTTTAVNGANLQRKWVTGSTTLAKYNGGKGVTAGEFSIITADGTATTVGIDPTTDLTLNDVISKINTESTVKQGVPPVSVQTVTASINANGDGLLLTDNTTGARKLTVADTNGTAATNLNIVGTATTNTIDGSEEKTIAITATDTLANVQTKINDLGWGVQASIINDGSGAAAYRLSLNATGSGVAGQVTFDAGQTKLNTRTLVKAQDAAVFVGSADGGSPLLITSSSNSITGAVKGLTLNLTSVSKNPVTVSVVNDVSNVTTAIDTFVQNYNDLVDKIGAYTQFGVNNASATSTVKNADGSTTTTNSDGSITTVKADGTKSTTDPNAGTTKTVVTTSADGTQTTYKEGVLLGDYSVSQIQDQLNSTIQTIVPQAGKYRILASVGLTVGDGGHLQFDADKFNAAYADDPNSVKTLFTNTSSSVNPNSALRYLNDGKGVATGGDGVDDFKATLNDGTTFNVSIGEVKTLGEIISSINAAGKGKLTASLTDNHQIQVTDLTTGTGTTTLEQLNASQFLANVGLTGKLSDGVVTGAQLSSIDPIATASGGIGVHLQKTLNSLINPVDGLIPNESNTLDDRITQYQSRISDLNAILANKKQRLIDQFNNMETVLAKLQSQQSSLGQIKSLAA